jgi:O-succinylbenzoate synthase
MGGGITMNIQSVSLSVLSAPLKAPFVTHLETVKTREAILIEIIDHDGRKGHGEAVPFSSPWYTEETIKTCLHMLEDYLIPLLLCSQLTHPDELDQLYRGIRRNNMAKSGIGQAVWDLYAKQQNTYLGTLFGGTREKVAAGVVVAANDIVLAIKQIEIFLEEGYQRFKVKIDRNHDLSLLSEIRNHYPDISLMADANSSYTLKDVEHIKKLDEYQLLMIEQPLGFDDVVEHSLLQKQINTPLCLDESICSFHDAKDALFLQSCQIINVKMSRVGGWSEAAAIHALCLKEEVPVWCGGMIEFGVSRAHNVALASLPGFTIPGDLSSSARYWETDIIEPEMVLENGYMNVPTKPGIGVDINEKQLALMTTYRKKFNAN